MTEDKANDLCQTYILPPCKFGLNEITNNVVRQATTIEKRSNVLHVAENGKSTQYPYEKNWN
jgi:hypothetical protein